MPRQRGLRLGRVALECSRPVMAVPTTCNVFEPVGFCANGNYKSKLHVKKNCAYVVINSWKEKRTDSKTQPKSFTFPYTSYFHNHYHYHMKIIIT